MIPRRGGEVQNFTVLEGGRSRGGCGKKYGRESAPEGLATQSTANQVFSAWSIQRIL
jgi:hypothetical protein